MCNICNGTQNVHPVLNLIEEVNMTTFIGKEGEYQIHNSSLIYQIKLNLEGEVSSNNIIHLTTESIENLDDRKGVKLKLSEIEWDDITYAMIG